jgi:hypothetical protein
VVGVSGWTILLGLNIVDNDSVIDLAGNKLGGGSSGGAARTATTGWPAETVRDPIGRRRHRRWSWCRRPVGGRTGAATCPGRDETGLRFD